MGYNLNFTSGALLYKETSIYIEAVQDIESYLEGQENISYFVIPTNSESSKKKLKQTIDKRLKKLNVDYLEFYREIAHEKDQKIILFLALCKLHSILVEFAIEVVYQKWKIYDNKLDTYEFSYFLSKKLGDKEFDTISEKTKYKLSQIAVLIFKQVGIYDSEKINMIEPSRGLIDLIEKYDDGWFFNCLMLKR